MHSQTTDGAGDSRRSFHLVISHLVERAYPGDSLSVAREACEIAPFTDRDTAIARLLSELDSNLSDGSLLALRRSFLLEVAVPCRMLGGGCPRRWAADRWPELLRRCGVATGAWPRAVQRQEVGDLLLSDLGASLDALGAGMRGRADAPGGVPSLALVVAGAVRRAEAEGAVPVSLAQRVAGVARAVGAASWAGEDVSHLAPALDALLPEVPLAFEVSEKATATALAPIAATPRIDCGGFAGLLRDIPPPEGGWGVASVDAA